MKWVAVYGGGSTRPDGQEQHWPPHGLDFPSIAKCIRCETQITHATEEKGSPRGTAKERETRRR